MPECPQVRLLHDARASIGEAPLVVGGSLWWTDPVERVLLHSSGERLEKISVAKPIWSLAALEGGALVGSLDDRFARIDRDGQVEEGAPANVGAGCRFNDMTAGRDGVLWVGAMHRGILAARGAIFRASNLMAEPVTVADGLGVPNGMKLSPDGRTLFVVDTLYRTLLAYPVIDDGLGEPAIVTDFLGLAGKPDGMTLAPDGTFWVAMWGGGSVVQIARDGATLRQIGIPAPHVSSLVFAAPSRLLVSTSRMRLSPRVLEEFPHSGALFEILLEERA